MSGFRDYLADVIAEATHNAGPGWAADEVLRQFPWFEELYVWDVDYMTTADGVVHKRYVTQWVRA